MPSSVYFPVRANAHSLVAGSPAASVRRRLIVAALMHDKVYVDGGMWLGWAGPTGMQEVRFRPGKAGRPETFDTGVRRGRAKGSNFYAAAKRDGTAGPPRVVMQSKTSIGWNATFEPFRRELPRAYPWLEFVEADLAAEGKRIVKKMVDADTRDGILKGLVPDDYSRQMVIANANFGLVMGAFAGTAVSMDQMHQNVIRARLERGEATPVYGPTALSVVFPTVEGMSWDDVDDARRTPGLPDLRALLAEIEEAAWAEADSGQELEEAIRLDYQRRFHEAVDRLVPHVKSTGVSIFVDFVIGIVTGPLSGLIGAGKSAATAAQERIAYERSWMTAAERLTGKRRA